MSLNLEGIDKETLRQWEIELLLEDAYNTIEFLHNCLTSPGYEYAYPEHTLDYLNDLREYVPERNVMICHHRLSKGLEEKCSKCLDSAEHLRKRDLVRQWKGKGRP